MGLDGYVNTSNRDHVFFLYCYFLSQGSIYFKYNKRLDMFPFFRFVRGFVQNMLEISASICAEPKQAPTHGIGVILGKCCARASIILKQHSRILKIAKYNSAI